MEPGNLHVGDVVQINPVIPDCAFRGCFMLVTDPKPWGAQGFVSMPASREKLPGRAYFRCKWADMEFVGIAQWVLPGDDEVSAADSAKPDEIQEKST